MTYLIKKTINNISLLFVIVSLFFGIQQSAADENEYLNMSLADLLQVEVSSVSRKQELLRNAGAAVFVITSEDIRRSGVTNIADALRMAPGVNVARINSNEWAVSVRGFNGRFANKLLVQMDGRSVYMPSLSGVYWDDQDTMLEDIDRIEVIRGPGATLWGSNAVNGIINIITKNSIDTQGGLAVVGGGNHEKKYASFRYGGAINDHVLGRVYFKYIDRNDLPDTLTGNPAGDAWDSLRGGFRIDGEPNARDKVTIQGDIYKNNENQFYAKLAQESPPYTAAVADVFQTDGWNTLVRWERSLAGDDAFALQVYIDHVQRDELMIGQEYDTFDFDFQHHMSLGDSQQVVWGMGYRNIREKVKNTFAVSLFAPSPSFSVSSAFIQDDIKLGSDGLHLIVGSKFERNDFTGMEIQPNTRLIWSIDDMRTVWGSISRAVHTPSRADYYGEATIGVIPPLPPFVPTAIPVLAEGNQNLASETLIAYEMGYRGQTSETFNFDIALFYNVYEKLRSFEPAPTGFNIMSDSKIKGFSYGGEFAADWQAQDWWRLRLAYSYLQTQVHTIDGSNSNSSVVSFETSSPDHQVSLRSSMSLGSDIELDVWGRYNSKLIHVNPGSTVAGTKSPPAYMEMDIRLGWQVSEGLELSITGQNLLQTRHLEFIQELSVQYIRPTSVERFVRAQLTWLF